MAQSNVDAETRRSGRQEYPEDRFDRIPRSGRVGVHRVTARPRHIWQYLIVGLLGFALLTTIGVIIVQGGGGSGGPIKSTSTASQPRASETPAVLDPAATVAVLDGTQIPNLGASVDQTITAEGWGQILFSEKIADSNVEISAVFYRDPADEAAARGLAEKLGGVSTYATEEYAELGARLIVLLGADYAGPGADAAAQAEAPAPEEAAADGAAGEADPSTEAPVE